MDNFKAIYKILTALEACLDLEEANIEMFNAKALGITEERWKKYMEMMQDIGYIKGVSITRYLDGSSDVDCEGIQITLKGLEYLQENSIMQKIYKKVKGVKDVIPGI